MTRVIAPLRLPLEALGGLAPLPMERHGAARRDGMRRPVEPPTQPTKCMIIPL